jgi:hypothetical protein
MPERFAQTDFVDLESHNKNRISSVSEPKINLGAPHSI